MLQHAAVSGHESGGSETEYLPEWKIPRHHCENDTHRLERNPRFSFGRLHRLIGEESLRVPGVVPTGERALFRFGHGGEDRLAHLQRHEPAELLLFRFENLRRAEHARRAVVDRGQPMLSISALGFVELSVELFLGERLERPERLASSGVRRAYHLSFSIELILSH